MGVKNKELKGKNTCVPVGPGAGSGLVEQDQICALHGVLRKLVDLVPAPDGSGQMVCQSGSPCLEEPAAKKAKKEEKMTSVQVLGLPKDFTEQKVRDVFSKYAVIKTCNVQKDDTDSASAILKMKTAEAAKWLVDNIHNNIPMGMKVPVKVSFVPEYTPPKPGAVPEKISQDKPASRMCAAQLTCYIHGKLRGLHTLIPLNDGTGRLRCAEGHECRGLGVPMGRKLCVFFENGHCSKGDRCVYAHGENDQREVKKTQKCAFFDKGECKSGDRCAFAHGDDELFIPTCPYTGKQVPQDGDWYCPGCEALQFKKSRKCLRCKTEKPDQGGAKAGDEGQAALENQNQEDDEERKKMQQAQKAMMQQQMQQQMMQMQMQESIAKHMEEQKKIQQMMYENQGMLQEVEEEEQKMMRMEQKIQAMTQLLQQRGVNVPTGNLNASIDYQNGVKVGMQAMQPGPQFPNPGMQVMQPGPQFPNVGGAPGVAERMLMLASGGPVAQAKSKSSGPAPALDPSMGSWPSNMDSKPMKPLPSIPGLIGVEGGQMGLDQKPLEFKPPETPGAHPPATSISKPPTHSPQPPPPPPVAKSGAFEKPAKPSKHPPPPASFAPLGSIAHTNPRNAPEKPAREPKFPPPPASFAPLGSISVTKTTPNKPPSAPAQSGDEYEVALEGRGSEHGMSLDRGLELKVKSINGGLAEAWNLAHPDNKISVGDTIIEVNGKRSNSTELVIALFASIEGSSTHKLKFRRSK